MKRNPDVLDRLAPLFEPPGRGFEDLLRRREKRERARKVGAIALVTAIIATFVAFGLGTDGRNKQPADPTPTPTGTALRRDGEVIGYSRWDPRRSGDLVAQNPDTGEVRTLVSAGMLRRPLQAGEVDVGRSNVLIGSSAWSADGRWVAFEVVACGGVNSTDAAGKGGLWVTNGVDDPRQLTRPCFENPDVAPYAELWAWSPVGAQLVVASRSIEGDALVLIDPATGDRTDLGDTVGHVASLAWSPDGTRITYATMRGRGSVYSVGVDGGDHSLLASSVGYGSIVWSPDGAHILFRADPASEVYLMNADGSDLRQLAEDGKVWGISWSPDGTRFAYATFSGGREERQMQIWTEPPDGSAPSLLFESAPAPFESGGSPVWSPDGTQIAFEHPRTDGETVWLVANADGTGDAREIDELRYLSWRGGWYFCECYG